MVLTPWILNDPEGGSFSTVEKLNLKTRPDSPVRRLCLLLVVFL